MSLADTNKAIGKVSKLLAEQLNVKTGLNITIGRPQPLSGGSTKNTLNLFLYEANFDASLKNYPLDQGQAAPLWLVLKYIMTAFDDNGDTDSESAHENIGIGIQALQEFSCIPLDNISFSDPDILNALEDNPDVLKITFDEVTADLISKLMQGSEDKYRFSIGFQVRPVMIASPEPPAYSLLVGIDFTQTPNKIIDTAGIRIPVLPSMGPRITRISPLKFGINDKLTVFGTDLNLNNLTIRLGEAELPVTSQMPDKLECIIAEALISDIISAGTHPVSVIQVLPTGRRRSSNLLTGNLLPGLTGANITGTFYTDNKAYCNITLTGNLLASDNDDIFVAFVQNGSSIKMVDAEFSFASPNSELRMKDSDAIPPGKYRLILRVNGQQAKNSPEIEIPPP